jgi:cytochrome c-type biogenesis protein CcmH
VRLSRPALLAVLLALAVSAAGTVAWAAAPATTLPVIERQYMCVTCKIPLDVAQSPQAGRERSYIQSLIDEGDTPAQIKTALVGQYGPAVLGLPSTNGFDLTAYLVPAAVLLALIVGLALLLPRWRRARGVSAREPHSAALDAGDAARLDADLARFD